MAGTQEKCSLGRFFGKEAECVAAGGICSSRLQAGRAGSVLTPPGPDSAASVETGRAGEKAAGAGTESCHITQEIIVMNSVMKSETPVTGTRK